MTIEGGSFLKSLNKSCQNFTKISIKIFKTLFAPVGVVSILLKKRNLGFGKPSPSGPKRLSGESCCMDDSPPPQALTLSLFYPAPLAVSLRGFDKTTSSHQLLRVIFYPLLGALKDCTLYIL